MHGSHGRDLPQFTDIEAGRLDTLNTKNMGSTVNAIESLVEMTQS